MYKQAKITSGFQVDMRAEEVRSHVADGITVLDVTFDNQFSAYWCA